MRSIAFTCCAVASISRTSLLRLVTLRSSVPWRIGLINIALRFCCCCCRCRRTWRDMRLRHGCTVTLQWRTPNRGVLASLACRLISVAVLWACRHWSVHRQVFKPRLELLFPVSWSCDATGSILLDTPNWPRSPGVSLVRNVCYLIVLFISMWVLDWDFRSKKLSIWTKIHVCSIYISTPRLWSGELNSVFVAVCQE